MSRNSFNTTSMLWFYKNGYRVLDDGKMMDPEGKIIHTRSAHKCYLFKCKNVNENTGHCYIHRLAAYQKYGEAMFENGIVVRHLNGDKADNSLDNIAIGTLSQNQRDRSKEEMTAAALKCWESGLNRNRKIPLEMIARIAEDKDNGMIEKEIAKKYNLNYACIRNIMSRHVKGFQR